MNGFAVLKQDDPQYVVPHFRDARPATNPAVRLDFLAQGVSNRTLNLFILDYGAVGTPTGVSVLEAADPGSPGACAIS